MDKYLAGQALNITVDLVDSAGALINTTAVSYRLLNEVGTVIVGATSIVGFVAGSATATVPTSDANNTLGANEVRGLRTIELTLTTADGPRLLTQSYLIEALDPIRVPDESFQTLAQAELVATTMPQISAWNAASRDARVEALIEARLRISSMAFRIVFDDPQSHIEPEFGVSDLKLLTTEEFNNLSEEFRRALNRAQIFEADDLLQGTSTIEGKRRAGVLSETIGESSMMFRGSPAKRAVGLRASQTLGKYLVRQGLRIGRA